MMFVSTNTATRKRFSHSSLV